jgi:hypothetical protein
VVTAVRVEGRTKVDVARDYGVSPRGVYELCHSSMPNGNLGSSEIQATHRSPHKTSEVVEDELVALRKELTDLGVHAGA